MEGGGGGVGLEHTRWEEGGVKAMARSSVRFTGRACSGAPVPPAPADPPAPAEPPAPRGPLGPLGPPARAWS